ncbi:MAG TPA: metallopeptidase family protein [bacterium]|nr:metallopeptidase family protein [bacterium]
MPDEIFEKLVQEGVAAIPKKYLDHLENVAIVIGDDPTPHQRRKLRLRPHMSLFGLYEGIPQIKRMNYSGVIPDKITIFKNPMLRRFRTLEGIRHRVKMTVWHEIAHHFGLNEREVREAERKRPRNL